MDLKGRNIRNFTRLVVSVWFSELSSESISPLCFCPLAFQIGEAAGPLEGEVSAACPELVPGDNGYRSTPDTAHYTGHESQT